MKFNIGPDVYQVDQFGVIQHMNPVPFTYDEKYVNIYNTKAYKAKSDYLQALRLGFALAAHRKMPATLTDVGYGNGAFMSHAKEAIPHVWGFDVTGVQVEGCYIMPKIVNCDVVTFWDCLEHFHDVSFLATLPVETLVVSLPYCHFHTEGKTWFEKEYKHRKPSEHIRHFNEHSLTAMMAHYGWKSVAVSGHEDVVRKSTHGLQNILSMAFKRK